MLADSRNLIFVGMPGSGKSTVGVLVAKKLGLGFIDTDLLIPPTFTLFERNENDALFRYAGTKVAQPR